MKQFLDFDPRFRHLGLKVGVFLTLLVLILALMTGVLVWRQDLFAPAVYFQVRPERADAILPGMDVTLHGIRVGRVISVSLGTDGKPEMQLRVREQAAKWLYSDATVRLCGLDFFSSPFLALLPGQPNSGELSPNTELPFEREHTIGEIASKVEEQLRPVISETALILEELNRPDGDLLSSLANLRMVSSSLAAGVPLVLEETQLAASSGRQFMEILASDESDLSLSGENLKVLTEEFRTRMPALLQRAGRSLAAMERSTAILEKTLVTSSNDIQLTVKKSGAVTQKAETLLDDIRNVWFMKAFLPRKQKTQSSTAAEQE